MSHKAELMNKYTAASTKLEKRIRANWRLWAYLRLVQLKGGFSVYHRFGTFGASWNKYKLQHPSRLLNRRTVRYHAQNWWLHGRTSSSDYRVMEPISGRSVCSIIHYYQHHTFNSMSSKYSYNIIHRHAKQLVIPGFEGLIQTD